MLDVHAPHASTHTWRDFFIHIATIVVGLFIAVGLEQLVEALHHRHERTELLAALDQESRQIIQDATTCEAREKELLSWEQAYAQQVKIEIQQHKPYSDPPGVTLVAAESPDNPIYKAAKASGKLALLSDEEIADYGELDQLMLLQRQASDQRRDAVGGGTQVIELYRLSDDPKVYLPVPEEDLRRLYLSVEADSMGYRAVLMMDSAAKSAAEQLLKGERDLGKIQQAERSSTPGFYAYH